MNYLSWLPLTSFYPQTLLHCALEESLEDQTGLYYEVIQTDRAAWGLVIGLIIISRYLDICISHVKTKCSWVF